MQKQAKSHTRSIRAISKAENEFLDRVWYERKLVLLQKLKSGEEIPDQYLQYKNKFITKFFIIN